MGDNTIQQAIFNKASKDVFHLVFEIPLALKQWNSKFITSNPKLVYRDSLQFSVFGTVVPGIDVPALTLPYAGQNLKISSHARPAYEEIQVGFTVDNRFQNWWVIWKWLNLLNDAKSSYYDQDKVGSADKNYMRNYQTDLTIIALDEYKKPIINFVYTKAFPTHLEGINYDNKDSEQIVSSFTFSFSQLIPTPVFL